MDDELDEDEIVGPASGGYDAFGAADDDDDDWEEDDSGPSEAIALEEAMEKRGKDERTFYDGLAQKDDEDRKKRVVEHRERSMVLIRKKEALAAKERELRALEREIDALGMEEIDRRVDMYRKGQLYGVEHAPAPLPSDTVDGVLGARRSDTALESPRLSIEADTAFTKPFASLHDAKSAPTPTPSTSSPVRDEQEFEKPFASLSDAPNTESEPAPVPAKSPVHAVPDPVDEAEAKAALGKLIEEKEVALEKTHGNRKLLEAERDRRRAELAHEKALLNEEERAVVALERRLRMS